LDSGVCTPARYITNARLMNPTAHHPCGMQASRHKSSALDIGLCSPGYVYEAPYRVLGQRDNRYVASLLNSVRAIKVLVVGSITLAPHASNV